MSQTALPPDVLTERTFRLDRDALGVDCAQIAVGEEVDETVRALGRISGFLWNLQSASPVN